MVCLARGEWQKAIDDLSIALAEEPTATRFYHQAQAYYQGKQTKAAKESMGRADDYGLKAEHLQPLERPAYRQLREDLQ